MDSYTMIGLVVGCAVGGLLFIIIVVIVCLVLREGWRESKRQSRISRYRASSPPGAQNYYSSAVAATASSHESIGIAYNDPSMYAADIQSIRPESLWRRSIRHFRNALRPQPSSAEVGGTGSGKGFDHSLLNSNSSGSSSKKRMMMPTDELELRFPSPSHAPQLQPHVALGEGRAGGESRHSHGHDLTHAHSVGAPSLLPRTALPTAAANFGGGGGYVNADLERYYALLQPAGVLADGEVLYYCRTRDYYDLSDFFDIVAKKDGGWLVKPVPGLPPPPPPRLLQHPPPSRRPSPTYSSVLPPRSEFLPAGSGSSGVNGGRMPIAAPLRTWTQPAPQAAGEAARHPVGDDRRHRFASAYDLYRPSAPFVGGFGLGLMKRTLSQSDDLHRSAHADRIRDRRAGGRDSGGGLPVVATPFGPAHRASGGRLLNGGGPPSAADALADMAVYEDIHDGGGRGGDNTPPPPPPRSDLRPAKPPRAAASALIEATADTVDGVVQRRSRGGVASSDGRLGALGGGGGGGGATALWREIGDGIVASPLETATGLQPTPRQAAAAQLPLISSQQEPPGWEARSMKRSDSSGSVGRRASSKRSRRRTSSQSPSGSRSSRKAKATETPVLVSSRVLHESSVSLAAASAGGGGETTLQGPLRITAVQRDVEPPAAIAIGVSERSVETILAPPPPPSTTPPPLRPDSAAVAGAATSSGTGMASQPPQETRQSSKGLSATAAAALASMPELQTAGSKDTVSTIKSYSRHIAEEFKFLDTYEGSTGTPASM